MDSTKSDTVDRLIANHAWLRGLARALVDERDVDDVLQETYAAALESPPKSPQKIRAWAASVVRRKAARIQRSEHRRRRREREVAQAELIPSTCDRLAEHQLRSRAVSAVLGLPEPYRKVVLMRFLDGMPPREIARALGTSSATVRSLLHRGLQRLRRALRLDVPEHRKEFAALLLLVGFERKRLSISAVVTTLVALAAMVGLAAWVAFASPERFPIRPALDAVLAAARERPVPSSARIERGATPATREGVRPEARIVVRGGVVNAFGAPVRDVDLVWVGLESAKQLGAAESGIPVARSGADGHFRASVPARPGVLLATGRFAAVRASVFGERQSDGLEPCIVVGKRVRNVRGRILDERGEPVAGASVTTTWQLFRFSRPVDDLLELPVPATRTNGDGRYELPWMIKGPKLGVFARKVGYRGQAIWDRGGVFNGTLRRSLWLGERRICGRVVDASGRSLPGVVLRCEAARTVTDASGRFDFRAPSYYEKLFAIRRGFRPVELTAPDTDWIDVEIRVDEPELTIEGVIVGSDGAPVAGLLVNPFDARRLFGWGLVERQADSRPTVRGPLGLLASCVTDARGRFRIGGLGDRPYRLSVVDPDSWFSLRTPSIAAGTAGHRIVLPRTRRIRVLSGRLVDSRGNAVAGAHVEVQVVLMPLPRNPKLHRCASCRSDAAGRFQLEEVPRGARLAVSGRSIYRSTHDVAALRGVKNVRIRVPSKRYVRVLRTKGLAKRSTVALEDGDGRRVPFVASSRSGKEIVTQDVASWRDSIVYGVPDTVRVAVWCGPGYEYRQPLDLRGTGVHELQLPQSVAKAHVARSR